MLKNKLKIILILFLSVILSVLSINYYVKNFGNLYIVSSDEEIPLAQTVTHELDDKL